MFMWAAIAAAAILFMIALVSWRHRPRKKDALSYEDFVELGRAAWIDVRDDVRADDARDEGSRLSQ
jgi:hypothetical protein